MVTRHVGTKGMGFCTVKLKVEIVVTRKTAYS